MPDVIDLDLIILENSFRTVQSAIDIIAAQKVEEMTIAVHPAHNLDVSQMPDSVKESYLRNTRKFLEYCKTKAIPIIHFRDMLTFLDDLIRESGEEPFHEPSMGERFGVPSDYEIPTFPNMGVPLDLVPQYTQQIPIYRIFSPTIFMGNEHKIQIVNGIGTFAEPNACLVDGVSVMDAIARDEVRIIQECILPKRAGTFDISKFRETYGLSEERVRLYSFSNGTISRGT